MLKKKLTYSIYKYNKPIEQYGYSAVAYSLTLFVTFMSQIFTSLKSIRALFSKIFNVKLMILCFLFFSAYISNSFIDMKKQKNLFQNFLNNNFNLLFFQRLVLTIIFMIFFSLQLGIDSFFNTYFVILLPKKFITFLFQDYFLWCIPFVFLFIWLLHIVFYFTISLLRNYFIDSQEVGQSIRAIFNKQVSKFFYVLLIDFPIAVIGFNILSAHSKNNAADMEITVEFFNAFNQFGNLFIYSTSSVYPIIFLSFLLLISYAYYYFKFKNIILVNYNYLFNISVSYILFFFILLAVIYCNNALLLIFLIESILLLLLNLLRMQDNIKNIGLFLKSVLIFLIPQAIATVLFCYGLSLIYVEEPSLNYSRISDQVRVFSTYFFETNQFIMVGSTYLILGLLIKMGLGPLGIWIFSAINSFSYPFLALYFSFIKPLYFTVITKLVGNVFSTLYSAQGFIKQPISLQVTDPTLLEYFKYCLNASNITGQKILLSDSQLSELLITTQIYRENINLAILIFSFFSVLVGSFGLLRTNDFKKFIAYSSILNYGFVFYPIISGYLGSVHFSVLYIYVYSLLNILFIFLFNVLTTQNDISNLTLIREKNPGLAILLVSFIVSMSGLPPFIGFFTKIAVLLEIVKILGVTLGGIFILFTLLSAFGYARLIKNIYGFNFKNFKTDILNSMINIKSVNMWKLDSFVYIFVLVIFIFGFIINTFCGLYIYIINPSTFTIFNSFVFMTTPHFDNTIIYHNYIKQFSIEFNFSIQDLLTIIKESYLKNPEFINNVIENHTSKFIEKQTILTGVSPTAEEIAHFKNELLHIYKQGVKSNFEDKNSNAEKYVSFCQKAANLYIKK